MTPEEVAGSVGQLVSLPRAYHRISEMMDDPRYGAADIGKVIAHEPALTARVLRMVNSAYYHFPSKIDNIPLAITVLGTRALRDLVLATSVASAFAKISSKLVDVSDFWHHSIYSGIMARLLSKRLKIGEAEQLFIAGLLHDIGKLVIYSQLPDESSEVLQRFSDSEERLFVVEHRVLGFDHSDVGRALLTQWELPEIFPAVAAYHHFPDKAKDFIDEISLVHAADALTKKVEPGHKVPHHEDDTPVLNPVAAERINLTPDMVEDLRLEADVQSIEVFSTLFSGTPISH